VVAFVALADPAAAVVADAPTFVVQVGPRVGPDARSAPVQPDGRPIYTSEVTRIPWRIREWMTGLSWRAGCPVPLRRLRLVTLRYWGFDDEAHTGRLVVHRDVARKVASAFGRLYAVSFPIRQMRLVDRYGADDRTSMEHDNTSASTAGGVPVSRASGRCTPTARRSTSTPSRTRSCSTAGSHHRTRRRTWIARIGGPG
jgi:hypothetical protein